METEHFFTCPYCWQRISVLVDLSTDRASYVEDCEVCCRPIRIEYSVANDHIDDFDAFSLDE